MAIAKTKLISFSSSIDNIDNVLLRFIKIRNFHPVSANKIIDTVHGLTSFTSDNPCSDLVKELDEVEKAYGLKFPLNKIDVLVDDLENIRNFVDDVYKKISITNETIKNAEERIRKFEEVLIQLRNIESLDISLDDLFQTQYVAVRIGKIPTESIERLKYYNSKPYVFKSFKVEEGYSWCMYFTTNEYRREIDNLFTSLFFERIWIPDFVHGTPEKAKEALEAELKLAREELEKVKDQIKSIAESQSTRLSTMKSEIHLLNEIYEAKKYVIGMGERFQIQGFAEDKDVERVLEMFKDMDDVEIVVMPSDSDSRITPPTKLKNAKIFKPFEMFTEMYGLPRSNQIDPTPIVAITYSLLFGIMFGDMGQGIVLSILGFLLYKIKGVRLGGVMISLGISSTIFGFFYGSLFGFEHMSDWFYQLFGMDHGINVMDAEYTMPMIMMTVGIGILLILISMFINIVQRIKNRDYGELLFSHNGLCGFLFYGFLIAGILPMITDMMMPGLLNLDYNILKIQFIIPFMMLPLILIFLKEPLSRKLFEGHKMFPNGILGFFVEAFFELFETILSYITSTISFMRVGGFVISHAGMMLVVHTLMTMVGGGGNDVGFVMVAIFGNLFVMALEGLVVGIQCLRLEFYEMFSRYYDGGGIAFEASK